MSSGRVAGPTQTASNELQQREWEGHPLVARVVRFSIFIAPLVVAILASLWASRVYPAERLGLNRWVWWIGLSVLATILVRILERITAKLTPLAMLFRLSLIFPDQAPSRFSVALKTGSTRSVKRRLAEIQESGQAFSPEESYSEQMLQLVAVLAEHDRMTRGHAERVRAYSELIGEEMGLSGEDLGKLRWAALLHDMGKLHVPAEILNKDGKPDDDEWAILKEHPAESEAYLEPLAEWLGEWRHAAVGHHERWDGNGYPAGLKGVEIPLAARIVAVADAFDVMTSTRSYKSAMPAELARQEVSDKAGSQFDPVVARAFLSIGLGDLRRTAGPLAWLTNLPFLRGVPLGNAITTTASSAATTATSAATSAATAAAAIAVNVVAGAPVAEPPTLAFADQAAPTMIIDDISGQEDQILDGVFTIESEDSFTVTITRQPSSGIVELRSDRTTGTGTFTFTPDLHVNGDDTFAFGACNDDGLCTEATGSLSLSPVDDPPTFGNSAYGIEEGETSVLALDVREVDGEPLAISLGAQPENATVRLEDQNLVVSHDGSETPLIQLRVDATDGRTSVSRVLAIGVQPTNDVPTAVGESRSTVEDQPLTLSVESLLENDSDPDSPSLELVDLGRPENGTIIRNGDELTFTPNDGFFGRAGFTYSVTDGDATSAPVRVIVTVTDVDKPPVFDTQAVSFSIPEDAERGSILADGPVVASDPEGETVTYRLGDLSDTFTIDTDTGDLIVDSSALNFESINSYSLTVVAADPAGNERNQAITIEVLDRNDPPIAAAVDVAPVPEDAVLDYLVATVSGSDEDGDSIGYSIVGGDGADIMSIDPRSGKISLDAPVNFEKVSSYDLVVALTDSALPPRETLVEIDIAIADVNDPPSLLSNPSLSISEASAPGDSVDQGDLRASDEDGDAVTYALSDPSGRFTIDPISGRLTRTAASIDHETLDSYTVQLTLTDAPNDGKTVVPLTIDITDVNDAPEFVLPFPALTADENMASGRIATVAVTDQDSDVVTYQLTGEAGLPFRIEDDGGIWLTAATDHETVESYDVTITVTDTAVQPLSTSIQTTIAINDVNEAPVVGNAQRFAIPENSAVGTSPTPSNVSAFDVDGDALTYELIDPSGAFSIEPTTGKLIVDQAILDHETAPELPVTIIARDGNGLTDSASATIDVGETNEAPAIGGPVGRVTVDENSPVGTLVDSSINASDPEGNNLRFTITDPSSLFAIDATTGAIRVNTATLDHETIDTYSVTVTVDDSLSGGTGTDSVTFDIAVDDVNEAPTITTTSIPVIAEDTAIGTTVATLDSVDPELTQAEWSLGGGAGVAVFDISPTTGELTISAPLDADTTASYTLTVVATDPNGLDDVRDFTVVIGNIDEPPVVTPGQTVTVRENVILGTYATPPVEVIDPEGDPVTWTLTDPSNTFDIDPNSGAIFTTGLVDHEDTPSYDVVVTATGSPADAPSTETVTIEVDNVDEPPELDSTRFDIWEDTALGEFGSISYNDPEGDAVEIFVVGGTGVGTFSVSTDGAVELIAPLDYESTETYTLILVAREVDNPGVQASTTVRINVFDVNEAPVITAGQSFSIVDNEPISTAVTGNSGQVVATDPEGDTISFSIVGGSGQAFFDIDTEGTITLADDVDFTQTPSYVLDIEATDDGDPALTTTGSVTVNIESQFGAAPSPFFGDVVFDEVLFASHLSTDPAAGLANEDFAELVNVSGASIDLAGWTIADHPIGELDATHLTTHEFGPLDLQPDDRLVHWITPDVSDRSSAPSADHQVHADTGSRNALRARDDLFLYDDNDLLVAYIAWGDPTDPGGEVASQPPVDWGLWDDSFEISLQTAEQRSISLATDGGSATQSGCWELTSSGDAQDVGRCAGAADTADRDRNALRFNSVGSPNELRQRLDHLVISEYSVAGMAGDVNDNFIEVYNASPFIFDLRDLDLSLYTGGALQETVSLTSLTTAELFLPGEYVLLAQNNGAFAASADQLFSTSLNGWNYGFELVHTADGTVQDTVGSSNNSVREGAGLPTTFRISGRPQSFERHDGSPFGSCKDSNDNAADFHKNIDTITANNRANGAEFCAEPTYATGTGPRVVISEVQTGPSGSENEFIELFNRSTDGAAISLDGYTVYENDGLLATLPSVVLAPGEHFLLGGQTYGGPQDLGYTKNISREAVVELRDDTGSVVDSITFGTAAGQLPYTSSATISYQRQGSGCAFTGDALQDFVWTASPTPTVSGSTEACS